MGKALPDFKYEKPLWEKGLSVLGIDEAGRGAFAGPLAVAGVLFDRNLYKYLSTLKINDSKLLSAKRRETLYKDIKKYAIFSEVELVDLRSINSLGIARATTHGIEKIHKKAYAAHKNIHLLIDAFKIPNVTQQSAIIHGDRLSVSIAAASILAKVERDKYMSSLSSRFSSYGWDKNKGYGTELHRKAIKDFGPCEHHRTQFIARYV